ncbi:MAG: lysine--tRNA ligase [Nitrososphaerota archaeon]|uniref:lysine--tRNA ligase n=1 Tax=Candidatus Bathycorpusculum sp. TaxID=2994959 RepID=UPI002838DCB9|nr:lysine--tRNA ligase [Candidatus Termiticorpusculum sp.]MCL2257238.1 lysine--tRNA ligase [Candidatus Termiticorpusculum sp.]MCL2292636.1 lysine--tRNA ligase [Candidatus Termiticorpusculum sp.]MDR0459986.1 lysine--tRNA ligase [Nitrososphaerota archaeon]
MSEETIDTSSATSIIGHGTWYDMMAQKVVVREKQLGRNIGLIRTEMGLGASGFPHIGSLGDAARSNAVSLALNDLGYNSELVAYCDDKDGLRKVPAGLTNAGLEKYLGYPVSGIPDPFGCHESYGKHMSSLLLDALDKCGIQYKYYSANKVYKQGLLLKEIRDLLTDAQKVGQIVKEEVKQETYTEVLPYFAICEKCGHLYTTRAYRFDPKTDKVFYKCIGLEIKGKLIPGCGYEGEMDIKTGNGKLTWKSEFAARWRALDIRFEAYGKDIADSVRINDRISREVLAFEPPSHAKYEMFLDKGGKKISKSAGNVFTPQVWLQYGSPQSLLLLMLKRFVGTRSIDVSDIPLYMNELDELEDVYFDKKQLNPKETTRLKGIYKYCWSMKTPEKPSVHVPYNLLAFLTKMAPKDCLNDYIAEKLQTYGYLQKNQKIDENLAKRIEYTQNWSHDFEEIKETNVTLSPEAKKAITELLQNLPAADDSDKIQNTIFNAAKNNELKPGEFFKTLYTILMGAPQGPRLGPYVLAMGKQNVSKALERALNKQ